ncbi:MAG: hypothetical protein RXR16_08650 [Thermocladium sp.]
MPKKMSKKIIIRNHTVYVVEEGRERPVVRLLGEILDMYAFDILDEEYMHLDYLALHDGELIIDDFDESHLRRD